MQWGDNRWSLASTGGEIAHQLDGTQSSLPGITSLFNSQTSIPNHIFLQMDNSTAVAYVNKRGGARSQALSVQSLDVWAN